MSCEHCTCVCTSCADCGIAKESYASILHRLTPLALADPQPGDRWNEMLHWWMYVVEREGDTVITMCASAPCEFPTDAKREVRSLKEFKNWLLYPTNPNATWAMCDSRDNDVSWAGAAQGGGS